MIKKCERKINDILMSLPEEALVLDIGGASAPFKRANYLIDAVGYESIYWGQAKGPGKIMFNEKTFVKQDICSREPWLFRDKQFDFSICSHVLEDIRDPIWVCSEIIRVSKAGYIEIPSRLYETTFNLEAKNLAGASHHRWLVDLDNSGALRFTFKYMQIHSKATNKNKGLHKKDDLGMYLCLEWSDSFLFYENWLNSGKEIFEYYLNKPLTEKDVWKIYRKLGPRNILVEWLSYLKNTNSFAQRIFEAIKAENK